ncbi:MAG: hypothetical protein ABSB74_15880 [Tepidisphaeraceae bacterium]
MSRKTKDKSPATMPSETPTSEAKLETLRARDEPALTARFEALPNKPRNSLLYKPREISAATGKSLAKRFESPAGFTTPMSDEEKIAALTAKDTPQVLTGCVGLSRRLYWILRGIAELPAAPMPRKRINGVKPNESFIADWNAGHPAYDGALSETYLRDEVELWIKSCRAAWRAVELAAIQMDAKDTGISRWSIQAKTAVSRLSHVLGNPTANRDYFFAELLRHLRRYPELMLPDFYRCVDDLSKLVTMMLVVQSPGEMPQMESLLSLRDDQNIKAIMEAFCKLPGHRFFFNDIRTATKIGEHTLAKLLAALVNDGRLLHPTERGGYSLPTQPAT